LLLVDMAHFAGLVAGKVLNSPFDFADLVTTTTHKSLRGPRAGLIFYKKQLEERVNSAVFPAVQGGPHNNTIAAVAVQMKAVNTPEFHSYAAQIVKNSQTLAGELLRLGYSLATKGTDNHLILWDLRPLALTGSKMETLCDAVHITLNKNSVHGDVSALTPGGVRIGTPALTSRGFVEKDFVQVAQFLHEAAQLAVEIQKQTGNKLDAFKQAIEGNQQVQQLAKRVQQFSKQFFMPGLKTTTTTRE